MKRPSLREKVEVYEGLLSLIYATAVVPAKDQEQRMAELIKRVVDFGRARMGGELTEKEIRERINAAFYALSKPLESGATDEA